jgi:hypothetical protein
MGKPIDVRRSDSGMTITANMIRSILIRHQYKQIQFIQPLSLSETDALAIVSSSA